MNLENMKRSEDLSMEIVTIALPNFCHALVSFSDVPANAFA